MTLDAANRPPEDRTMESRMIRVEEDLAAIQVELAVVKERLGHCATKADLAEMKTSIIVWVVSAFVLTQILPALLNRLGL